MIDRRLDRLNWIWLVEVSACAELAIYLPSKNLVSSLSDVSWSFLLNDFNQRLNLLLLLLLSPIWLLLQLLLLLLMLLSPL